MRNKIASKTRASSSGSGSDAKPNKAPQTKKQQDKTEEAVRYFREHYNPNREQREITSSSYIRAQNRLNDNVNTWFGRGMSRKKRKR